MAGNDDDKSKEEQQGDQKETAAVSKVVDPLAPDGEFFHYFDSKKVRTQVRKTSIKHDSLCKIDLKYLKAEALSRNLAGVSQQTTSVQNTAWYLVEHNAGLLMGHYRKLAHDKEALEVECNREVKVLNTQLVSAHNVIAELKSEIEVLGKRLSDAPEESE